MQGRDKPAVYILTNKNNTTLYTGVTGNLRRRMYEHSIDRDPKSFARRYKTKKLVFYEFHSSMDHAITREKQIKGWIRNKKISLIESVNPAWEDLSPHI